jgi:hypothetical protein
MERTGAWRHRPPRRIFTRSLMEAGYMWLSGVTERSRSLRTGTTGSQLILRGVASGGGEFVAVGDGGVILASFDGTNWTSNPSGASVILRAVAYGKGNFVAVGDQGTILESTGTIPVRPGGGHRGADERVVADHADRSRGANLRRSSFDRLCQLGHAGEPADAGRVGQVCGQFRHQFFPAVLPRRWNVRRAPCDARILA